MRAPSRALESRTERVGRTPSLGDELTLHDDEGTPSW
jgi:hypothetical protein